MSIAMVLLSPLFYPIADCDWAGEIVSRVKQRASKYLVRAVQGMHDGSNAL